MRPRMLRLVLRRCAGSRHVGRVVDLLLHPRRLRPLEDMPDCVHLKHLPPAHNPYTFPNAARAKVYLRGGRRRRRGGGVRRKSPYDCDCATATVTATTTTICSSSSSSRVAKEGQLHCVKGALKQRIHYNRREVKDLPPPPNRLTAESSLALPPLPPLPPPRPLPLPSLPLTTQLRTTNHAQHTPYRAGRYKV